MEARLPADKLQRTRELVSSWMFRKTATKREILSLIGVLQHATRIVQPGRTFLSRMYATAAKLHKLHFYTRLNKEFRSYLCWWDIFLESWNSLSLLQCTTTQTWGGHSSCSHFPWKKAPQPQEPDASVWILQLWITIWSTVHIMSKELLPIVLSVRCEAHYWLNTKYYSSVITVVW